MATNMTTEEMLEMMEKRIAELEAQLAEQKAQVASNTAKIQENRQGISSNQETMKAHKEGFLARMMNQEAAATKFTVDAWTEMAPSAETLEKMDQPVEKKEGPGLMEKMTKVAEEQGAMTADVFKDEAGIE